MLFKDFLDVNTSLLGVSLEGHSKVYYGIKKNQFPEEFFNKKVALVSAAVFFTVHGIQIILE